MNTAAIHHNLGCRWSSVRMVGQRYATHRSTCPVRSAFMGLLKSVGDQVSAFADACRPGSCAAGLLGGAIAPYLIKLLYIGYLQLILKLHAATSPLSGSCAICDARGARPSCTATAVQWLGATTCDNMSRAAAATSRTWLMTASSSPLDDGLSAEL
jgi:hypothetical protein